MAVPAPPSSSRHMPSLSPIGPVGMYTALFAVAYVLKGNFV